MDYSAANVSLWNFIIQLGMIAGAILLANMLRSRVGFIRRAMMPGHGTVRFESDAGRVRQRRGGAPREGGDAKRRRGPGEEQGRDGA